MEYSIDNEKFKTYVSSRMCNEDKEGCSEKELINNIVKCFESEYLFPNNLKRYKTVKNVLIEWLKGLPSCLNVDFYYFDIINIYKSLELDGFSYDELNEEQESKVLDNYWVLVADSLNQIYIENNKGKKIW